MSQNVRKNVTRITQIGVIYSQFLVFLIKINRVKLTVKWRDLRVLLYRGGSLSQVMGNNVSVNFNIALLRELCMIYYLPRGLASAAEFFTNVDGSSDICNIVIYWPNC